MRRARRSKAQKRQIDLATANVRSAQVQLDYCTVRAPFAGVVIAKSAQVGEIVSPFSAGGGFTRTGIGTIVDMDSLEIEVDVNEAYINRVQPGQPVESVLNAYPDWKIPSHVIAIIPTADRSKATVKVRIGLDLKDDRIVPDMGVRVSFLEAAAKAGAGAGAAAGRRARAGGGGAHRGQRRMWSSCSPTARRGGASWRSAARLDGARQVLSGLAAGETVIADPPAAAEGRRGREHGQVVSAARTASRTHRSFCQ